MRPPAVLVDRLTKSFRVNRPRGGGVAARVHDFVTPQTERVVAVDRKSTRLNSSH